MRCAVGRVVDQDPRQHLIPGQHELALVPVLEELTGTEIILDGGTVNS